MSIQPAPIPPSRILHLEGGCNFRDLGGYRTREGRELKWGRMFRSGVLSYFTLQDQQQLIPLGVGAICDLRYAEERERERTRWPDTNTEHLSWNDGTAPPTIRSVR
jgi:protein-tyrosine phosphatase